VHRFKFVCFFALVLLCGCLPPAEPMAQTAAPSGGSYEYTPAGGVTAVVFDGSSARIDGAGAVFSGGTLVIEQAGVYSFSGVLENGRILVDTGGEHAGEAVQIVLAGLSLHSEAGSAIYAPGAESVSLIIEDGSQNALSSALVSASSAVVFVRNSLHISGGGSLSVNAVAGQGAAGGHGIQALGALAVSGGSLEIQARLNGILSDGDVAISGGDISITDCYEGIEGRTVTISGGRISIVSRDDAINASGGAALNDMFVRITGGDVYLHALGDGIDSNGNIFLEGGRLNISAPSRFFEGAIDFDGFFLVSGGEMVTAGSVRGVSPDSTQPIIVITSIGLWASGSVIDVRDMDGNILLEYASRNAFSHMGLTSGRFRVGETYALYINGQRRLDIPLAGMVTML